MYFLLTPPARLGHVTWRRATGTLRSRTCSSLTPRVLGRPVVVCVEWRAAGRGHSLPAVPGALDERVYRPEDAAANRMPAVRIRWHADHHRSVIPKYLHIAQRVRALPHGGVARSMPGGRWKSLVESVAAQFGRLGLNVGVVSNPARFWHSCAEKALQTSLRTMLGVCVEQRRRSPGERRDDSLLGRARGEQRARLPRCCVRGRTRAA